VSGRSATAAVIAEWGKASNRPVHLFEFDFNPWIYMTDAGIDVVWNGHTYLPSQALGFSGVSETSQLLVNTCTVTLSGVDQQVVALLLQETYLNRKMKVRVAMLNESLQVIADPVLIFDGRMDRPSVSIEDGTTVCSVDGVSHWADFERRSGRHSNDTEQRKHFTGDLGFFQVAVLPEEIYWGIRQKLGDSLKVRTYQRRPGSRP